MQGIFSYILKGEQKKVEKVYEDLKLSYEEKNNDIFSKHEAECLLHSCDGVTKCDGEYSITLGLKESCNISHVEFTAYDMAEFLASKYKDLELDGIGGLLDFEISDFYSPAGSSTLEVIETAEELELLVEEGDSSAYFTCSLCDSENEVEIDEIDEDGITLDWTCCVCDKEYTLNIILDIEID